MSAPLDTDRLISTELADLRRQVFELQQALADARHSRAAPHLSALGAAQVGTWEWEGRTDRVTWSPETEQIFGLPPGSFDGTYQGFFTRVHPDDRQGLSAAVAQAVRRPDSLPNRTSNYHARWIPPVGGVPRPCHVRRKRTGDRHVRHD